MRSEAKVGLFLFIGFVLLFALSTQVGSFKNLAKEGYSLRAYLKNAAGLNENSKVKANGLDVGYIKSLSIENKSILAELFIYDKIKLPKDSTIKPIQESLLGGKYLEISIGKSPEFLKAGDLINSAPEKLTIQDASDAMAKAANEFKSFIEDFRQIITPKVREELKKTFSNLEQITGELNKLMSLDLLKDTLTNFNDMAKNISSVGEGFKQSADTLNSKLPQILTNLDILVKDLKIASANLKDKMPKLASRFEKIEEDLESIIAQNRKPLNNTLVSADTFFSSGTQTFTKIEDMIETIDKVKLEVAMRSDYMGDDKYAKGYLSLNYIPSDTKSYRFAVVGMDDYSRMDENGNLKEPKKHESSNILISAQIAKRVDDIVLRGGLIESSVGAGFDYYFFNDRFVTSAEVYDFNAQNDIRGTNPHAKIGARYNFLKHLDIYGGYDNFLNKKAKNAYIGIGLRFFDDDLKKLVMSQNLGAYAK